MDLNKEVSEKVMGEETIEIDGRVFLVSGEPLPDYCSKLDLAFQVAIKSRLFVKYMLSSDGSNWYLFEDVMNGSDYVGQNIVGVGRHLSLLIVEIALGELNK